jgi:hypothetical protein
VPPYFFAFRFFDVFRLAAFFLLAFFGTFFPLARASESPIAIACFLLFTFLPERPLFKVPALRFFMVRLTSVEAFFEYFRAMDYLPFMGKVIFAWRESSGTRNLQAIAA